jgi:DNA repair exonuclease SbcCD ATPase subunit
MISKNIKELDKNLNDVVSELAETTKLKKELDAKDASQPLSDLEAQLESAKSRKDSILKQYASGRVSREDLKVVQDEIFAIETTIAEEKEIADATHDYQLDLSKKIFKLNQKERDAHYRYWFAVTELLKQKTAAAVKDEVDLVWASACKADILIGYPFFLTTIFPQPSPERIVELQSVLRKKYESTS